MTDDGEITQELNGIGVSERGGPAKDPEQQRQGKTDGSGNDLVPGEAGDECTECQQTGALQQDSQNARQHRLDIRIAVHEEERNIEKENRDKRRVHQNRGKPFPDDNVELADRRSDQQLNGALAFLFRQQPHADERNQKQSDHRDIGEQRGDHLLIYIHRHRLAAQLTFKPGPHKALADEEGKRATQQRKNAQ